jgi:hypothetical protein
MSDRPGTGSGLSFRLTKGSGRILDDDRRAERAVEAAIGGWSLGAGGGELFDGGIVVGREARIKFSAAQRGRLFRWLCWLTTLIEGVLAREFNQFAGTSHRSVLGCPSQMIAPLRWLALSCHHYVSSDTPFEHVNPLGQRLQYVQRGGSVPSIKQFSRAVQLRSLRVSRDAH